MPKIKVPLFYIYGNDVDMMEKKWLPDFEKKNQDASFLRYDATIDEIQPGRMITEYVSNDLFSARKIFIIRNPEEQTNKVETFVEGVLENPVDTNAVVMVAAKHNKVTRLGKLVKEHFKVLEFEIPEVKPFDLLDAINSKNGSRIIQQSNKLFSAEFNALALYSLLCGHFFLMKKVKERENKPSDFIARELGEHQFRIQKMMVANRYWSTAEINQAIRNLAKLGDQIRSWQYDEQMLLQMYLINISL